MNDWDKILDDFAHKCGDGGPDMTNPRHLALLRESLIKFGWKENATNEILGNLRTLQVLKEPLVEAKEKLKRLSRVTGYFPPRQVRGQTIMKWKISQKNYERLG